MSKEKGASVYITAQEALAIDNALDLISTTLERASVIPPELANASAGLHSITDKLSAVRRRQKAREIREHNIDEVISGGLPFLRGEDKAAGSAD